MKCKRGGDDKMSKMRLSVPSMPNLEPFLIDIRLNQLNRVVSVDVQLSLVTAKANDGKRQIYLKRLFGIAYDSNRLLLKSNGKYWRDVGRFMSDNVGLCRTGCRTTLD